MRVLVLALLAALALLVAGCDRSAAAHVDAAASDAGKGDGGKAGGRAALLAGGDGGPADDAIPPASSEDLTSRMKHLLEAISQDNPDLSTDVVFPRDGYLAMRDTPDPARMWDKSIKAPFKKSVHRLRKKKGMEHAQFVNFELGHAVVQSHPHRGGWKKPLWIVRHSKLTFTIDGKTNRIDVSEMTAWRGAWYVTRLR